METTTTNQKNKSFTRTLTFIILLSLCGIWLLPQQAAAFSGSGTAGSPYVIETESDWTSFKNGTYGSGVYWKLNTDLSLDERDYIGTYAKPFTGSFDGNGKTITLPATFGNSKTNYVAIFSYTKDATIKNLNVAVSSISVGNYSGGLIADATGTLSLDNIHVKKASTNDKVTIGSSYWGGACRKA